jgi:hypothetical protein
MWRDWSDVSRRLVVQHIQGMVLNRFHCIAYSVTNRFLDLFCVYDSFYFLHTNDNLQNVFHHIFHNFSLHNNAVIK